jgi:acyl-CoA synthetase (AMP-forming)/AMP-acid ligase II
MPAYWNLPETTTQNIWRSTDGTIYFRTGDLGEIDADGYLTLRGRAKDLIISGGLNVYPIDIEAAFLADAAVKDVAVVGVSDPKWGEVPVAYVRAVAGETDASSMLQRVNRGLGKAQRVKDVVIIDEDFPRNTLGKVVKADLVEDYRSRSSAREG